MAGMKAPFAQRPAVINGGQAQPNGQRERKPDAKLWINVGYMSTNPITGEDEFVSLPVGIALDTMDPVKERGSNPEWLALAQAKNQLMLQLQQWAEQCLAEAGAEEVIPDLQVQIRRVKDAESAPIAENNHVARLQGLSFMQRSA